MVKGRCDGLLWMLIRTGAGVLWQSLSDDLGASWTEGSPTEIVNPDLRFRIRRLASGRPLLISTTDPKNRQRIVATLGDSEPAITFSRSLELDGRNLVSYSDAIQSPDGLGEIRLSVFMEEEFA